MASDDTPNAKGPIPDELTLQDFAWMLNPKMVDRTAAPGLKSASVLSSEREAEPFKQQYFSTLERGFDAPLSQETRVPASRFGFEAEPQLNTEAGIALAERRSRLEQQLERALVSSSRPKPPPDPFGTLKIAQEQWLLASENSMAGLLTDELQQLQQSMDESGQGFEAPTSGLNQQVDPTNTESLLAELQVLQESMNRPANSLRTSGLSFSDGSGNAMAGQGSFSTDSGDILGFSFDSHYSLDNLLMSPSPDPLLRTSSGFPLLDTSFLGPALGTYSPPNPRGVPSPLDLINQDFVTDYQRPEFAAPPFASQQASTANIGAREVARPSYRRSTSLGQTSTQSPPYTSSMPTQAPPYSRSTSLGQTSTQTPSQFASFSRLDHTKPPQGAGPPQNSDAPADNSRLVSAAEIMQALSRLPARGFAREAFKTPKPAEPRQRCRPASSLSAALSLHCQDAGASELWVQMSNEKLDSLRNRELRRGYVEELAELRAWCLDKLSEGVVRNLAGVHYLACNALPVAHYRVARLMISKVTLWLQQMQSNVRRISPVDLYMTIHEAGRIFLDSDLSLLSNIPSQEARNDFEKMYLVMEIMKKEAAEGLRFSDAEVNPQVKAETDVKPKIPGHVSGSNGSGRWASDAGASGNASEKSEPKRVTEVGGLGRNKRKDVPAGSAKQTGVREGEEGLKRRLGLTNQLGNKGSEQQRQWLKGLHHELARLNADEQVVMFNANPGGLAPVRRFVSEAGLMAKYNLRMASWRLLAAASEKFDTLAKGVLPSFEKYLGFAKYILGTCVGLTMAFCAIAGRETELGNWDPKAEALQSLLERTKKGTELAAELACITTDLRTYEEDLLKLRVNAVGVMMREGGRSQQEAILLLEQRAETILTALVAEVTSPPSNNPVLWTCWQLIFDFSRTQIAFNIVDDLDAKVQGFFVVSSG